MCSISSLKKTCISSVVVPKFKLFLTLSSFSVFLLYVCIKYLSFPAYYPIRHSIFYTEKRETSGETYLVNTNSCRILYWPPFTEEILPFYINRTGKTIRCHFDRTNSKRLKAFRYNYTAIKIKNLDNLMKSHKCYALPIIRDSDSDSKLYLGPKLGPLSPITYFKDQFIQIKCYLNSNNSTVYEEIIPLIQRVNPSLKISPNEDSKESNLPNILLIGLDSVSRLNFQRHFPFTKKLIEELKFHPLYGYTKVADNTFVNLVPLLTGEFVNKFWNETISDKTYFDSLPFIWKQYEKRGHVSLFAEDASYMNTFNLQKQGFQKQPTHYYLRPFSLAIEKHVANYCYKDRMELEIYLDYLKDFIHSMKENNEKYFALMFLARLTHNEVNNCGFADLPAFNLFSYLSNQNLLNDSVIVFFSDHGIRFGPIRRTLTGKIEERLPFMFIHIPNSLNSHNLKINENRLTTPFDIHAMLTHIVKGKADRSLSHGLSLLEEIPDRSCSEASIEEHWCVCKMSENKINNNEVINPMAHYIIETLNEMLNSYRNICHIHKLDRVLSAYQQRFSDKVLKFDQSINDVVNRHVVYSNQLKEYIKFYLITVRTEPKHAIFEATVKLNEETNVLSLVGDISRINRYGSQKCISNSHLKKYCLCK